MSNNGGASRRARSVDEEAALKLSTLDRGLQIMRQAGSAKVVFIRLSDWRFLRDLWLEFGGLVVPILELIAELGPTLRRSCKELLSPLASLQGPA
jgi:hypothetical protein